ncbi:MAG: hypothetical protein ACYDEH_04805 [Acidimicrobiales bacterium]
MTNQIQPTDQADALSDEITLHVQRYNPRLLTAGQRASMLDDIRVAVLKSEPPNKELAGNWLSVLCKFISQSTPAVGGQFTDYFTNARIEAWVNGSLQRNTPPHTLRSNKGLLARILRAHQGLPVRMAHNLPTAVVTPPLGNADLALIKAGCIAVGLPALRGFVAGFCAGVVDDSGDGARFERCDHGAILRLVDGRALPLLASPVDLEMVSGSTLRDGDWREVRAIANELKIHLDSKIATRTFRSLIVTEPEPFAVLAARFGLTERSVSSLIDHLPPVDIIYDATLVSTLRGDRDVPLEPLAAQKPPVRPTCSKGASAPDRHGDHRLTRPSDVDRGRGGPTMTSRISRTKAQRLATEARTKAAAYPEISDSIRTYISGYRPAVIDDDTWAAIGPELREAMLRAGYLGQNHVRKMCSALSCYLGWRLAQRLPVAMADALNDDAIDQFYLRGMSDLGDRTKNDYRSLLHRLAARVSPEAAVARSVSRGRNDVRPGYTSVEEAVIRRVCMSHRKGETRRRLCALVGFSGGGGIDSQDFRWLHGRNVEVRDDGIHVQTEGPKARHVIIRRLYEPLVLAAIEGVKPDDLIVNLSINKANPAARVIAEAQLFDDVPHIEVRRLRTTWISWAITQRIPLNVILEATGLTSAGTLIDMVSYLPKSDDTSLLRDGDSL